MQQEITPLPCCPISEKDIIVICKHSSRSKIDVYATDITSLQHPLYKGRYLLKGISRSKIQKM